MSSGLAAVFNEDGARQLVTFDLNTTLGRTLSLVVRMNDADGDAQQPCPGPDRPVEAVYVHSSCNAGVTWSLLAHIAPMAAG